MKKNVLVPPRRAMILGAAASLVVVSTASAATLLRTPRQPLGPFYPDQMPLDLDNDLVRITGERASAVGQVTHVHGRLTDPEGRPVGGALVEIWQCDSKGRYIHTDDARRGPADPHFQGYGRTNTGRDGAYRFRTIRPVPYPGRTPHIHFSVRARGFDPLVTQMYVAGERRNARDGLLQSIRDPAARRALIVALDPAGSLEAGALAGRFDLVIGRAS